MGCKHQTVLLDSDCVECPDTPCPTWKCQECGVKFSPSELVIKLAKSALMFGYDAGRVALGVDTPAPFAEQSVAWDNFMLVIRELSSDGGPPDLMGPIGPPISSN